MSEESPAQEFVRIVTGKFPMAVRDRLHLLKAKRYVKVQEKESVEDLLQLAVQVGLDELEKEV